MKSSRPITPTRGVLFCAALLLFCVVQSVAQSNYTFCSNNSYSGGAGSPAYFTPVFPLPDSIHPDEYNQGMTTFLTPEPVPVPGFPWQQPRIFPRRNLVSVMPIPMNISIPAHPTTNAAPADSTPSTTQ